MSSTFEVRDGYNRNKTPRMITVRAMTLDEIKQLRSGDHVSFLALDGSLRHLKINGQVRRWKREPDRVEVPVKYGLREYAALSTFDVLQRFVVEVSQ